MTASMLNHANKGDFEESALFYGRWTAEEERYAEMLITEFRDGNLDEATRREAPTTLRGFLAHMLGCAPKRISKVRRTSVGHACTFYTGPCALTFFDLPLLPEIRELRIQR